LFKTLNIKKFIFNAVNSEHTLFVRASKSCSNILTVKSILNAVKKLRDKLCFQGKVKSLNNPER